MACPPAPHRAQRRALATAAAFTRSPRVDTQAPPPTLLTLSTLTAPTDLSLSPQADDADKVKAILLSSQTERLLLNTNWKVRSNLNMHLRKRATQFGVEVPMEFGAFNIRPRNTCAS